MRKELQTLKIFSTLLMMILSVASYGQETLQERFDGMMEQYSSYERYKVIPITTMNEFWLEIEDSLDTKDRKVSQLNGKIVALDAMIDSLESELSKVKGNLRASEETNAEISFIGIPFNKTVYHLMVWGIILVLVILGLVAYFMYLRSNNLTSRYRKDLDQIRKEYEGHRDKSREMQVRLKRDLQTAVNTIEDMKRGGNRR